jgi:thermitase
MWKAWRPRPVMATLAATAVVAILTAWPVHAAGTGPSARISAVPSRAEPTFAPGELLVRFRSGVGAARRAAVRADEDARLRRSLRLPGLELLRLAPGQSVRAAAEEFEDDPDVLYAEPNFYYHLDAIPNDPRFGELWGLNNRRSGRVVGEVHRGSSMTMPVQQR